MKEQYEEFLKLIDNEKTEQSKMLMVMSTLQDYGNEKKFELFQYILDNINPEDIGELSVTIACVAWWYGEKLNRENYIEKAIAYYTKIETKEKAERLFKGFRNGSWKPNFGFERELFGIKE